MTNVFYFTPKNRLNQSIDIVSGQRLSHVLSPKELLNRAENLRDLMLALTSFLETMQQQMKQQ